MEQEEREIYEYMGIVAKSVLASGGKIKIKIETGSMKPTLQIGEEVLGISKNNVTIRSGDIIIFRQLYGESILVHRCLFIIKVRKEKYYFTKGDNGLNFDPLVLEDRVYGVVYTEKKMFTDFFYKKFQYLFLPIYLVITILFRLVILVNDNILKKMKHFTLRKRGE